MAIFMSFKRIIFIFSLIIGALTFGTFQSCYYDNEAYLYPDAPSCTDTTSTYNTHVKAILDNQCVGCHGPGENPDLSTYTGVITYKESVVCRVVDMNNCTSGGVMPPSGGMNVCDVAAFALWQQNGYQE